MGKKIVAIEDSESMAKYIIFQIVILIDDWDIVLDIKTYWETIIKKKMQTNHIPNPQLSLISIVLA